jgi:hypothetical protein
MMNDEQQLSVKLFPGFSDERQYTTRKRKRKANFRGAPRVTTLLTVQYSSQGSTGKGANYNREWPISPDSVLPSL